MADLSRTLVAGELVVVDDSTFGRSLYVTEKLGVGIKAPTESIDVLGNVKISGSLMTSATTLDFKDSGSAYIGTKASSLVLASAADSYTAPSNGAYIQGNVGIGVSNPLYRLDVSGDIRLSGQLRSTIGGSTPPLIVSSSSLVANLNADKLDGYEASDLYNASIISTGYGIISGCTTAAVTSALQITVNAGTFLLKDIGYRTISTQNYGGFVANTKHIVFIAGKTAIEGGKNLTAGQVAIAAGTSADYPDMTAFTNPIILCKVDIPMGISAMSNSYIYANRTMLSLVSDPINNSISLFPSDNPNVSIQSGGHILTNRIVVKPNGDSTLISISNIGPLKLELSPHLISFKNNTAEQTVTSNKIITWDDAGSKKHTHVYDSSLYSISDDGNGHSIITISDPIAISKNNIRIYINGLRQKRDVDYVHDSGNAKIMTLTKLIDTTYDNVIIDYDI